MTFARKGVVPPYTDDFVRRMDAACAVHGCRKFWIAVDPHGRHHAGLYIVWDGKSTYALMNGMNPAFRTSGALSLCFWWAIQYAAQHTRTFDFSGSMLQPVERFFRSFGARQVPYSRMTMTPSRLLRMQQALSSLLRGH